MNAADGSGTQALSATPPRVSTPWLTVREAALYSRWHPQTVREKCREYQRTSGRDGLKCAQPKPNACFRIHIADLERAINGDAPSKGIRRLAA